MSSAEILVSLESVLKLVEDNLDDVLYPDETDAIKVAQAFIRKNK